MEEESSRASLWSHSGRDQSTLTPNWINGPLSGWLQRTHSGIQAAPSMWSGFLHLVLKGLHPPPNLPTRWQQTKIGTWPHPCCSLQIVSTLRQWFELEGKWGGYEGKVKYGTCILPNVVIYYTAVFGNGMYSQCQWLWLSDRRYLAKLWL